MERIYLRLSAVLTLLLLLFPAVGQDQLRVGIPTSACQDEFGMMWIGTQDGLFRYDGTSLLEAFRPEEGNSYSIYNNNIKYLCADGHGSIFIICKFALCRYDMRSERFLTIRKTDVQAIDYDGGELWVATSYMIWRLKGDELIPFLDLQGRAGRIYSICKSGSTLYVGTDSGLLSIDPNGKVTEEIPRIRVNSMYLDSRRALWVCTHSEGISVLSPSGIIEYSEIK